MRAPWNASWSGEAEYEIRPCRWVGGKLAIWSPHRPGSGRPIFAKPHMVRQRRSIAEMRCTVCGEKTDEANRWWFGLGGPIKEGGLWATTESPVHHDCAVIALRLCPHLKSLGILPKQMPKPDLILSAVVGGIATEEDFGVRINGRTVIGHLKLAWRCTPPLPDRAA